MKQTTGLTPDNYAREWRRTQPDFVVRLPQSEFSDEGDNQQLIVIPLQSGRFLATWTTATVENHDNQRVVVAHSDDGGRTWSEPLVVDGSQPGDAPGCGLASWSILIEAPRLGRVYILYNKNIGITDARADTTGVTRIRYSEDGGLTWSQQYADLREDRRFEHDHPDQKVPINFVACFQSFLASDGVPVWGVTRWGSGSPHLFQVNSEICFWRFENLLTEPDPTKLRLSTWPFLGPGGSRGLRFPKPGEPTVSVLQEPSTVTLPDGRLFCVMRTLAGHLACSIGTPDAREWSEARPLRYHDGGDLVLNPISPAPIFDLQDGRYMLLFHNNDGTAFGASGPMDYQRNRQPMYLSVASFDDSVEQPLRFGSPVLLMSSDHIALGPSQRVEPCSYPSFFVHQGQRFLWYPDRKHFLLGKLITDEILSSATNRGAST